MRLVDLSPRSGFALLALGALGAGCSDGISAPRATQSGDAGPVAERDSAAQLAVEGGAIYWPDSGELPAEILALLEAGALDPKKDGEVLYPCLTRLASDSFALDVSDCATRPAEPCTAADPARAKWLFEPSDFIADELFAECGQDAGWYPVGITFNEQGCADRFYSFPLPPSHPLLLCYLRALQQRRYPCGIGCSEYMYL